MIAAVLLALLAIAGGTLASYAYDDDSPILIRVATGTATGLVAVAALGFVVANVAGIAVAVLASGLVALLPLAALWRPSLRDRLVADLQDARAAVMSAARDPDLSRLGPILYVGAISLLLWFVFGRVIVEQDGGLATGYVNNLGDMPFHVGVTTSFAYGQNFPPTDPTFAGTGFVYPYLSDFLTAMFVAQGATMREAFLIGNLALGLSLVGVLYQFTRLVTRDRLAAYLAPVLVLFSGGLGWLGIFGDAQASEGGLIALLGALPHDYTITSEGPFRWGNAITTLLVTQRSLLMGLPIAVIVFGLLWRLVRSDSTATSTIQPRVLAVAAGVLTGSLPLVHAHSFIVVMGTAFLMGLLFREWRSDRWRPWLVYVIVALAIALPQVWWSTRDSIASAGTFFGFELGWDHREENILWFWFINTGLFIPLSAVAAVWALRARTDARALLTFTLPFLAWFIVPNLVKLAPWVWDNIKVLFYWYVGFVPLVALLIAHWLRGDTVRRAAGVIAVLALTLAGGLDVWRAASGQTVYGEFDRDAVALADQVRADTAPRALLLAAPTWNATVFLTGRPTLLGYTGHVWSRGLPYADRERDIARIYAGDPDADALLAQYEIEYIVLGPIERGSLSVNDAYFERFALVAQAGEYELYEVPRP
jgi:hypothetical protein